MTSLFHDLSGAHTLLTTLWGGKQSLEPPRESDSLQRGRPGPAREGLPSQKGLMAAPSMLSDTN